MKKREEANMVVKNIFIDKTNEVSVANERDPETETGFEIKRKQLG